MRVSMPPRNIAFSVSLNNSGADDHLCGENSDDDEYMLGVFEPVSRHPPPAITMADDDDDLRSTTAAIHPPDQRSTGKPPLNSATPTRPVPSSPPYAPSSPVVYTSIPSPPSTPRSSPVSSPQPEYTPSLPDYYTSPSPDYNCTPSTPDYLPDYYPISPPYSPSSPVQYTPSSPVSSPLLECTPSLLEYYTPPSPDILHPHRTIISSPVYKSENIQIYKRQ